MKKTKKPAIIEHFDSIHDFIATNDSRSLNKEAFKDSASDAAMREKIRHNGKSWYGGDVKTYKDAQTLLEHGCSRISKKLVLQTNRGTMEKGEVTSYRPSIVGVAPIVPLAIKGVPNSMLAPTRAPIKEKVIHILYDISHNCGVKAKDIEAQGVRTIQAVRALETAGYRVELRAIQYFEQDPRDEVFTVLLKRASQPLDIKRISFPIIHSAMLRLFGFIWYERVPDGDIDFGYGFPLANKNYYDACETLKKQGLLDDNTVYINGTTNIERVLLKRYTG